MKDTYKLPDSVVSQGHFYFNYLFGKWTRMLNKIRLSPRGALHAWFKAPKLDQNDWYDIEFLKKFSVGAGAHQQPKADNQQTLVILSFMPLPYVVKMEWVIATLLKSRGWNVKILTNSSSEYFTKAYSDHVVGIEIYLFEDFISFSAIGKIKQAIEGLMKSSQLDVARIKQFSWNGVPVGVHALATYLSGTPEGRFIKSNQSLKQLSRILRRSMLHVQASNTFLEQINPHLIIGVEKGFVGTCEIYYAALLKKIDYVQWVGCHEPDSMMLKRYYWDTRRSHPFSICDRDWSWIRDIPWSDTYRDVVMEKFDSGYKKGEWFRYKSLTMAQCLTTPDELKSSLGLDKIKKTAVIYSHILSDANLFYGEDIFPHGYEEWLVETVRAAGKNTEVNWVLKLHPANKVRNLRLGYVGEYGEIQALKNAFGEVPSFLKIIYPEDKVSPLSFFQITDIGITVRGTIGIELPCLGVPVLTAGTGRYSGRGFTYDSAGIGEYVGLIEAIHTINPLTDSQTKLAIMYAYFVFKKRPAKYDEIFVDIYEQDQLHSRYRDFRCKKKSCAEVASHPQMKAILTFLEDKRLEDFISGSPVAARYSIS
jgi:hypothetical protein